MAVGDDPGGRRLWVVNPDADTISVLDALTGTKLAEHPTGADPRSVARDALGRYWVTCHDADEIRIHATDTGAIDKRLSGHNNYVRAVAVSDDGARLWSGG